MELPKMIFICVIMFLMSRESLCENIDRKEAVHNTIKDQGKHMQKRDHQGLIPQMLKLRQPINLSKQVTQTRPQTIQEVRTQMIPRKNLHDVPQALQQRSQPIQKRPQTIQQRPINLRLNPATNLQRRVTNVTKYPIHNNNTTTQSVVPNNSPPEPPKDLEVKTTPPKQERVSAPVPNKPVVHMLIPKETPDDDKNHKKADFFEDEDDENDNTSTHHPEYLNKMPVKYINKHDSKVQYLDNMEVNKKPDKIHLNNAEVRESSDHDDTKYDDENFTNKIKERNKGKLNAIEDDRYAVDDEDLFVQKPTKDDNITEKKIINKQPVPKTTNRTDKNKLNNSLKHSLTTNNYTGDNIISVKARKDENRNKDLKTEVKQNSITKQPMKTDKIDNVVIQNHTYEEIYERSINNNPSVLYNKIPRNIQTPEYSAYQDSSGESKFPIYSYTEDYGNQVPSTSNMKCVYNRYTNSYENDPNVFLNQDKPSFEYMNENQISGSVYDKPTNIDVADYYPKEPENYVNRIWRTWRNSEVIINNYRPIHENMHFKEVPGEKLIYNIEEPLNAVVPITHGNLIGVNGCYKNQNIPVTCRYCPNYQCYY